MRRSPRKGWGVYASCQIRSGEFVCEYVGEVVSNAEASKRLSTYDATQRNFLMVVREHVQDGHPPIRTNVDATQLGNVARWINHSCNPNCEIVLVCHSRLRTAYVHFCNAHIDEIFPSPAF